MSPAQADVAGSLLGSLAGGTLAVLLLVALFGAVAAAVLTVRAFANSLSEWVGS